MDGVWQRLLDGLWDNLLELLGHLAVTRRVALARARVSGVVNGVWDAVLDALWELLLGLVWDYCIETSTTGLFFFFFSAMPHHGDANDQTQGKQSFKSAGQFMSHIPIESPVAWDWLVVEDILMA